MNLSVPEMELWETLKIILKTFAYWRIKGAVLTTEIKRGLFMCHNFIVILCCNLFDVVYIFEALH